MKPVALDLCFDKYWYVKALAQGFVINVECWGWSGISVYLVGDVNDGFGDFIASSFVSNNTKGKSYVIFA